MTDTNPDPAETFALELIQDYGIDHSWRRALTQDIRAHDSALVAPLEARLAEVHRQLEEEKAKQRIDEAQCDEMTRTAADLAQKVATLEGKLAEAKTETPDKLGRWLEREQLAERARQVEALREENEALRALIADLDSDDFLQPLASAMLTEGLAAIAKKHGEPQQSQVEALTKRLEAAEKVVTVARKVHATCVLEHLALRDALVAYDAAQQAEEEP